MNETVLKLLGSEEPFDRRSGCESAGDSGDKGYIPHISTLLRDPDMSVREFAVNAVISLGGVEGAASVAPLLRDEDPVYRNIAIEILEAIGKESLPVLSKLLKDDDDDVVKFAVDIIATYEDEGTLELIAPLKSHPNTNVRGAAILCLGKIHTLSSLPILLEALDDDETWVRFSAIEGLRVLSQRDSVRSLLRIIDTEEGLIREAALEAVSTVTTPVESAAILLKLEPLIGGGDDLPIASIEEHLEKAMKLEENFNPSDEFIETYFDFFSRAIACGEFDEQLLALKGMGQLKVEEGINWVLEFIESLNELEEPLEPLIEEVLTNIASASDGAVDLLIEALKDRGKGVKVIIRTIGNIAPERGVTPLVELVEKVNKDDAREIVDALAAIGNSSAVEAIEVLLSSSDGHIRGSSVNALSELKGDGAIDELIEALHREEYEDIVETIVVSIAALASKKAKRALSSLLKSDDELIRGAGVMGLGLTGDKGLLETITPLSEDPSPAVRRSAYGAIASLGSEDGIDTLNVGMEEEDDDTRLAILSSLEGYDPEAVEALLIRALEADNMWVRYQGVLRLGSLGCRGSEERLIGILDGDDEYPVRVASAKALSELRSERAIPFLEELECCADDTLREASKAAIEVITS